MGEVPTALSFYVRFDGILENLRSTWILSSNRADWLSISRMFVPCQNFNQSAGLCASKDDCSLHYLRFLVMPTCLSIVDVMKIATRSRHSVFLYASVPVSPYVLELYVMLSSQGPSLLISHADDGPDYVGEQIRYS